MSSEEFKQHDAGPPPFTDSPGAPTAEKQYVSKPTWSDYSSRRKSPLVATVLSLMPGLGQVYVGYYQQGFINVLVIGSTITILVSGVEALEPLGGFFLAFYWLYNMIDAGRKATFYNEALAGIGPAVLPEDGGLAKGKGSLFGGVVLIIVGVIAFAHTMYDMPLDWIEDWWPILLVMAGAYLIYQSLTSDENRVH